MKIQEGLFLAKKQKLDLVEIVSNLKPPVCKILDFEKYKYKYKKQLFTSKKKQRIAEVKEIKFRPNIAVSDFNVKLNNIKKFIRNRNKIKITLFFKGREIMHKDIGMNVMQKIKMEILNFDNKIELDIKKEEKTISMIIIPK